MRVLVIAAHPDDEVFGCGGSMLRHAAAGDEVHVLVATRGAPPVFPPEQVATVWSELRQAHARLGVKDTQGLDFPAPRLDTVPGYELAEAIGRHLARLRPDVLYIPHHGDIHGDHQSVYRATLVAARPIKGCSVSRILAFETLSETEWARPGGEVAFVPTVFVDIGPYLEGKLASAGCYRSQMKDAPHPRSLAILRALAQLRGSTVGLEAAEAFMLVREIL